MKLYSQTLVFFFLFCSSFLLGQERILDFDVEVEVKEDRSIEVKEYIKVFSEGRKIKRGITRELLDSRKLENRKIKTKYDIINIQKNGINEKYHTESTGNGFIIYIGQREVFLNPGEYTYLIHYTVPNQIGFYADYDEIYWNAIGTDVDFKIENASCTVTLPNGAKPIQNFAYVGGYGEQGSDYSVEENGSILTYKVNRSLSPYEGLTFAIGFDKGIVKAPDFFSRYGTTIILGLGFLFLLPYFFFTWWKYGKDHPSPTSEIIFDVPDNLSPGAMAYVKNEGRKSDVSFATSVISLAIKGYIKIDKKESNSFFGGEDFSLYRTLKKKENLPVEESNILDFLFETKDYISIDGEYDPRMSNAMSTHHSILKNKYHDIVTQGNNQKYIILPMIISAIILILGIVSYASIPYTYGFNFFFIIAFVILALLGIILYSYLIKKPTIARLNLKSRIEGFGMYLGLIEDFENQPEPSVDHFEEFFPYALALGKESQWANKFKELLEKMNYRPTWNNNPDYFIYGTNFMPHFRNRSVTTSQKPPEPGSGGSGSGGGGFSGGGGGGGGVGGW